jgi:hypothetical protein
MRRHLPLLASPPRKEEAFPALVRPEALGPEAVAGLEVSGSELEGEERGSAAAPGVVEG